MTRKIRSILTISGVMIGIGAITFLISLGYGFEKMTTSQIASPNALSVFDAGLEDVERASITDENLAKVKNLPDVITVEPSVSLPAKAIHSFTKADVIVYGLGKNYLDLSDLKLQYGRMFRDKEEDNKAIASTAALTAFNISSSKFEDANLTLDIVTSEIISPALDEGSLVTIPGIKVSGVIDDNQSPFIILPFDLLRKEAGIVNYNGAKIKVNDKKNLQGVREKVEGLGMSTRFIGDTIQQITGFFNIFRYVVGGLGFIAMVVAILGMFNTLTVSLLERTREIGVLKSNGATRKDIKRLFLFEAISISVIGGVLGLLSGIIVGEVINLVFNIYAKRNGALPIDFFYAPFYFVIFTIMFMFVVGFVTGFYPARRATRIKILDTLKYE